MAKRTLKELTQSITTIFDAAHNGQKEVRTMPISKGDIFSFTLSDSLFNQREETIGGTLRKWVDIVADDGTAISATQITRKRNGLPLDGKTISERIESFLKLFKEDGTLTLSISNVKTRTFVDENGKYSSSNYYIFEVE